MLARRPAAVAACITALAVLVGCGSGPDQTVRATATAGGATAPANKSRTVAETRRLLSLAVLPSGAVTIPSPAGSSGGPLGVPAVGMPLTDSFVDAAAFYRVPLGFDAAVSFFRGHLPAGLTAAGTQTGTTKGRRSTGWLRTEPDSSSWTGAGFALTVAEVDAHSSDVRVDGEAEWVDTAATPASTDPTDPVLQILPTACPPTDRVGTTVATRVDNNGSGLKTSLLPADTPVRARICSYNGMNADGTPPFMLRVQHPLDAPAASTLAQKARNISLEHLHDGVHGCPMDDERMTFILFSYLSRTSVTLALKDNGCRSVTNGHLSVGVAGATASSGAEFEAFTSAVARAST